MKSTWKLRSGKKMADSALWSHAFSKACTYLEKGKAEWNLNFLYCFVDLAHFVGDNVSGEHWWGDITGLKKVNLSVAQIWQVLSGAEILSSLQVNNLVSYSFIDVGRGYETSRTDSKDFIIHSTICSMSISSWMSGTLSLGKSNLL